MPILDYVQRERHNPTNELTVNLAKTISQKLKMEQLDFTTTSTLENPNIRLLSDRKQQAEVLGNLLHDSKITFEAIDLMPDSVRVRLSEQQSIHIENNMRTGKVSSIGFTTKPETFEASNRAYEAIVKYAEGGNLNIVPAVAPKPSGAIHAPTH
jgi:hypothetical protein